MRLDTAYDFTKDIRNFRERHWAADPVKGKIMNGIDPDRLSDTLRRYQYLLNRREMPNGEFFDLKYHLDRYENGKPKNYTPVLVWNGMRFGNDSIIVSFRYSDRIFPLINEIVARPGYRDWVDDFESRAYTIGGEMLFPMHPSINSIRGINSEIRDRFDLTLECIWAFYNGDKRMENGKMQPLLDAVWENARFFGCFEDFEGYVDFFFLQDCIGDDGRPERYLRDTGLPKNLDDYDLFIRKELDFLKKRNERIAKTDLKEWPIIWDE